jgi:hypothetical protein
MTEEKKNEQTAQTATPADATASPETAAQTEPETENVPHDKKQRLLWLGAFALGLVVLAVIATLISSAMDRASSDAARKGTARSGSIPAASIQATSQGTTVVVPAVRGVDATGCQEEELTVEGNRLVFKNGCAKPVFYGK